jgi:hypothetical protein
MAFTPSTLSVILQTIGGVGMRFVSYRSDDPIATLTGTDYFARGTDYGLRLHDLIFVSPVSGTVEPYVLVGTAVDSEGNVTATQTAFDAELTVLAGLDKSDGNFIVGNGTTWVAESGATARASLGLTIGTDVQAYDADLSAIAALAKTDGNFIVGDGSTWVAESGNTATNSLTFTQGTVGDTTRTMLEFVRQGRINVCDLGVPSDGSSASAGLKRAFERGGALWIPEGTYNIPAENTTEGGVIATLTKSLDILCHPNAKFVAGTNFQNTSLIYFGVPSGGTGLPNELVSIFWEGGLFDSSLMMNPSSIPWSGTYPGANPGPSGSNTVFSPYGGFTSGSVNYCGFKRVVLKKARFKAGTHWITAGGDSMVGAGEGVELMIIEENEFVASRDTAIYGLVAFEGDANGQAGGPVIIRKNRFINCAGGASMKRSVPNPTIESNYAENCVAAFGIAGSAYDDRAQGGIIRGNLMKGCIRDVDVALADGVRIENNTSIDYGAVEDDGTTPITAIYSGFPIVMLGSKYCTVRGNRFKNKSSAWSAQSVSYFDIGNTTHTIDGTVKSAYNVFEDNVAFADMVDLGREQSGEAEYNTWSRNRIVGGSSQLSARDSTSKYVPLRAGTSCNYEESDLTAHSSTTSLTTIVSTTILGAEIPIHSGIKVSATVTVSGTNGTKLIAAKVGANSITTSNQTSGEQQTNGYVMEIRRVSSTGYTVGGRYWENGGTTGQIPGVIYGLGSGNFDVGIDVTLGHASDIVTPVSFVVEPL